MSKGRSLDDLDFTRRPSKSEIYDPKVARICFESLGNVELVPKGTVFFTENQNSDRMYLLEEGQVSVTRGGKAIDVVKAGEIFGEMAAISQLPRSATATARTGCRVVSLDAEQFQRAIQRMPEFALMLMIILINRLRLTVTMLSVTKALDASDGTRARRLLDDRLLRGLMVATQHRPPQHCPLNRVIMTEGEAGVFMYVVLSGRVAISIKNKLVEWVGPGGVFGEMALIDQSPRAATAVAETDCDLIAINRGDFLTMVKTKPDFAVSLLKAAADRLRDMTSRRA
ncbi:MAG TPA: cyclic nucleotide-binding domain-containing protein [Burkholderiales bacterium]|nr:cyclic nucleotide-binding domain-containing protein [Burkholderiales bacterium]